MLSLLSRACKISVCLKWKEIKFSWGSETRKGEGKGKLDGSISSRWGPWSYSFTVCLYLRVKPVHPWISLCRWIYSHVETTDGIALKPGWVNTGFFMLIMCGTHVEELCHISSPCMYMKRWTFFKAVLNLIIYLQDLWEHFKKRHIAFSSSVFLFH